MKKTGRLSSTLRCIWRQRKGRIFRKHKHFPNPVFFVDDGCSGTNCDRPGFQRMLTEIETECRNNYREKSLWDHRTKSERPWKPRHSGFVPSFLTESKGLSQESNKPECRFFHGNCKRLPSPCIDQVVRQSLFWFCYFDFVLFSVIFTPPCRLVPG